MNRRTVFRGAFAFVAALLLSATANAQLFRTYLAVSGNDANPCTLPQPCRLLPAALAAVASGGEVWMLDSANYNTTTVNITKSVTLLAVPGAVGSVLGNGGTAIAINAAGIEVTLQNLVIRSFNGDIGVLIGDAGSVNVIGSTILGFTGQAANGVGIWANTGASPTKVTVVNSIVRNGQHGIVVAGNARATISKSNIIGNAGVGVWSNSGTGTAIVHVNDTVATGNGAGFVATGSAGAFTSFLFATRATATENAGAGFSTDGGSTAYLAVGDSMSTVNGIGLDNAAGILQSRGNNTVTGNTTATTGTISALGGL